MTLLAATAFLLAGSAGAQDVVQLSDTVASQPEVYVVQPGDTLWDISRRFLGDPEYWPALWSINDYITNPHWIYPGNRIVFRMGTLVEPPSMELEGEPSGGSGGYVVEPVELREAEITCGPDVRFDRPRQARTYVAPGVLVPKGGIEFYGTLVKARTMQTFLAEGDLVYLRVDDPDAFSCGDVVGIYELLKKKVRHPETHRRLGQLYRVVGEAVVVHRYGDVLAARIRRSWTEASRGDLVGPPLPVAVEIEAAVPEGDLDGVIVERVGQEQYSMGTGETVFIDLGRADGVRVGDSFYIIEQRDQHEDLYRQDRSLPPSVVGRLVVVRVDDEISAAVITDANRSLEVGLAVVGTVD